MPPTALFSNGGIGVLTISSQVTPGGTAALTIKTKPGAVCTLSSEKRTLEFATTSNAARFEPIPGTATRVAGKDGVAAWIWPVEASQPAGALQLVVDCGDAGMARLQLNVIE